MPLGLDLPRDYGDATAEYRAVRQAAGIVDRSGVGLIEVTGRDGAAFLHAMLSNDIKGLAVGQGCSAAFLDVHGKVQALLVIWALPDRLLVLTPPGRAEATIEALDKYLFSEKAYLRDASGEFSLFMLAGPDALTLGQRLTGGASLPEAAWSHLTTVLGDVEVRLVRGGGETGETEVWVVAPVAAREGLWHRLIEAGARPVGHVAWDALRIEAGWPLYGQDVDVNVLLPEIPLDRLVSHTKGCYLGQEVVVRIRDRGHVNRHLRGLALEGDTIPEAGAAVEAGEVEVGRVTSAAWSFGLKRPVALAFVRRQHAEPGTAVVVRSGARTIPAAVTSLPVPR
jgi:folate-binding protein YgfZ